MQSTGPARPYARALFDIANGENELEGWKAQLDLIEELASDEVLDAAVSNPQVTQERALAIATRLRPAKLKEEAFNLVRLLIVNRRTRLASAIKQQFLELVDAAKGQVAVEARTAVPLQPDQFESVKAAVRRLTGREPRLATTVDPAIIGGLVLRIGDRVIDASLKTKAELLKKQIAESR